MQRPDFDRVCRAKGSSDQRKLLISFSLRITLCSVVLTMSSIILFYPPYFNRSVRQSNYCRAEIKLNWEKIRSSSLGNSDSFKYN
jgi:hypothetical protein